MKEEQQSLKLTLNEEQKMLAQTALQFVKENAPPGRLREFRDSKDPLGFSRDLWKGMGELGWLGLQLPEEHEGLGLGFFDLCIVLEAAGRNLMPEPFVSTLLLGMQALLLAGAETQKSTWLPGIASGEKLLSLAYEEEGSRQDPLRVALSAKRSSEGFVLSGRKIQVLDAYAADALIVAARTSGDPSCKEGITLFIVDPNANGVELTSLQRLDTRAAAIVELNNVQVSESDILGQLNEGGAILEAVLDRACIGIAAEALGAMQQAFEDTLSYIKEREQFGVAIASFQALQHRAARLYVEISLARSAVLAAARTVDERPEDTSKMASLAKVTTSETLMHVAKEAIQMHGGVGMTDEYDIGFYIKRAQACLVSFGDSNWHRRRWASLNAY